jgi:hypothetical protein
MLIDNLLLAIFVKFPFGEASTVVQQDYYAGHTLRSIILIFGTEWVEISLEFQPPNSPDMNLNDLCFFSKQ